jgi:hypothetical protein
MKTTRKIKIIRRRKRPVNIALRTFNWRHQRKENRAVVTVR